MSFRGTRPMNTYTFNVQEQRIFRTALDTWSKWKRHKYYGDQDKYGQCECVMNGKIRYKIQINGYEQRTSPAQAEWAYNTGWLPRNTKGTEYHVISHICGNSRCFNFEHLCCELNGENVSRRACHRRIESQTKIKRH